MKMWNPFRREVETKGLAFTPQSAAWEFFYPGSKFDYAKETGNGMNSSVVTAALGWVMRTFPEAPVVVERIERQGEQWNIVHDHRLAALLRQPNPFYGGRVLWMATIMDFSFGEAFWVKVRNGTDDVVELWWVPRQHMTPIADTETGQLDHYEYQVNGRKKGLDPRNVVHFRFGLNPHNILRGFSPLAAVMREVYIDDQAASFTASILRNLGIIGMIFSPKDGVAPKGYADELKKYVQENFTGDKKGQAMAFNAPTVAQVMQYNLQGFDVGPIRDVSEERVCAALAIQPAVVGFGTGLQQTKVGATMREVVKLSWETGIEPNQAIIANEMDRSLLPDFQANTGLFRTRFDTTQVDAVNESKSEKTTRVNTLVMGNIITVAQAQKELGYPVDGSQNKYLRELTAPEPESEPLAEPDPDPKDKEAADREKAEEKAFREREVKAQELAASREPLPAQITVRAPTVNVPPPVITVESPTVNVAPAAVTVEPAVIHLAPITVEAPIVNVQPPNVTVEPAVVNVAAPVVTVESPAVTVEQPNVVVHAHIPAQKSGTKTVEIKDKDGHVVRTGTITEGEE